MGVLDRRQTTPTATTTSSSSSSTDSAPSADVSLSSKAFYSRTGHCSVVKDSVLYVFGGRDGQSTNNPDFPTFIALNLTTELNANQPEWQVLPQANTIPVTNAQCILADTHLIVVGGTPLQSSLINPYATNATITYCGLQAYSFAEQKWQSLMPQTVNPTTVFLNLNRTGHATGWFEDIGNGQPGLFVFGGLSFNSTTPANDAFVMSPFVIPAIGGQPIIEATSLANILPPPLKNAGAAVVDDSTSILIFGGTTASSGELTTIWEYTPKTTGWKTLPATLPHGMPNAKTGWVDSQQSLIVVDVSSANTQGDNVVVNLANAGLRRRSLAHTNAPSSLNGASVAFDTDLNLAIVSGGSTTVDFNIFNMSTNAWSQSVFVEPTTTNTTTNTNSTATQSVSLQTSTGGAIKGQSTGFNKANLLAPIILGSVLGFLGLVGIILLFISKRHRKNQNAKKGKSHASVAAGLWLKYGNQKQSRDDENPYTKGPGGEIFLRNLEEKHGLKRAPTDRRKTGWSKYFSTGWYWSSSNNNAHRASASTAGTARALVDETRDHTGPYGGGWDTESRYSKASSFLSVVSVGDGKGMSGGGQWDRVSWSDQRKTRASNASSGVLGGTIDVPSMPSTSAFGAGGVRRI